MCGIAGIFGDLPGDPDQMVAIMANAIVHRGPDGGGTWHDEAAGIALAHRRLAILDLSPAGQQPMLSRAGRYVIVFNGEIYNHLELREDLGDFPWHGHSDTETILAAIEAWGIEPTLRRLVGMFAIALWDRERRQLTLARDRLGEKPLYYGWQGQAFVFGSELKSLRVHPGWRGEIDRNALTSYMRVGYVPSPHTIFCGVHKLLPGSYLTLGPSRVTREVPIPVGYWSALECTGEERESRRTDADAIAELDSLLRRAVAGQMVADVPLGAFLSGGVDSSTIVALMQAQSSIPVRTFSIGFAEGAYDEARHAKAVAMHLGTSHTELYVTPADALAVIPHLPQIYDEPFADSSQIPTYLVSRMAREHVKVSLSGDAGDELFGGYSRYFWGPAIWSRISAVPRPLRTVLSTLMTTLSPAQWDRLSCMIHGKRRGPAFGDKLHKLASVVDVADSGELYHRLISPQRESRSIVANAEEVAHWSKQQTAELAGSDLAERMMFQDIVGYLTDDILVKVDRAAMAVSLETRIPLLDHRVVEFALRLPLKFKLRGGQGKWLLRQVLYGYVPRELIERPKQGFSVPLDAWLRGPLRDWAETLLDAARLRQDGFLDAEPVRAKWHEHITGKRNWQHWLWNVLMFQAWLEQQHA